MKIWDISVRQPVFITMLVLALTVLGIISYFRIPVDLLPDVSFPVVTVTTRYPGASPEQVEEQVTSVLEEALGSLPGVDEISSTSAEGFSNVLIQFTLETDDEQAAQDVRERVSTLSNQLPRDVDDPVVRQFDFSELPIFTFAVADRSGQYSPAALRTFVEDQIQQPLERLRGVAVVEVEGGLEREVQVQLDLQALTARRIVPQQVVQALQSENLNIAGGAVRLGDQELSVRTVGEFESVDEIENVIVTERQGVPVRVGDVATVVDTFADRTTITRLNGEESIVVNVRKQSGTNTNAVAERVKGTLDEIRDANDNLDILVARDDSEFVQDSINDAIKDLIYGGLFATIVVLFFFRDVRSTIITMVGLPIILIGTFFFMDALGITLNSITVLALALCVGLVIDDAIVVRENIFRWLEMGHSPREAATKGTAEVALPVIASTATIVSVFLPIAYAQGIIGRFFREFGLTVTIAILISLAEAVTLAPMLSAYFFKQDQGSAREQAPDEQRGKERGGDAWLDRAYGRALNWALDHKRLALTISAVVIVVSLLSFPFVDQAFLPDFNQGEFNVSMQLSAGTPLAVTEREAIRLEERLLQQPEVADVFTTIGGAGTPDQASFFVKLKGGAEADTAAAIAALRERLSDVPADLAFQAANQQVGGSTTLGSRDLQIELVSKTESFQDVILASETLVAQLNMVPGLTDVGRSYRPGEPELRVRVDRERASDLGLSTSEIGATIRLLVNGQAASTFRGEGPEADIRVQLRQSEQGGVDQSTLNKLLNVNMLSRTGRLVPLRDLAALTLTSGPTEIQRIDRQPAIVVAGNYTGERPEADVQADVRALLDEYETPALSATLAGQAEAQQESFGNLFTALMLAVIFVYMALASQFGSFTQPVLIMLALPLAVIGAVLALVLTGRPFDMTAMIGMILLMGLVTKNSILLVDFANREREKGVGADEAMRRAGPIRLRPILMTALSLILGLVPVALTLGAGSNFRSPLATAVIGGMLTSTFLTLFVVPLAYSIWVGWLDRLALGDIGVSAGADTPRELQESETAG